MCWSIKGLCGLCAGGDVSVHYWRHFRNRGGVTTKSHPARVLRACMARQFGKMATTSGQRTCRSPSFCLKLKFKKNDVV